MICEKQAFASSKEANKELRRIVSFKNNNKRIPVRCYKCNRCGFYHLTSLARNPPPIKQVDLQYKNSWDELLKEQKRKENPFNVEPFLLQLEKRLKVILKNIEVECELQKMLFDKKISLIRRKFRIKSK